MSQPTRTVINLLEIFKTWKTVHWIFLLHRNLFLEFYLYLFALTFQTQSAVYNLILYEFKICSKIIV